jgi:L-fuconolactonase
MSDWITSDMSVLRRDFMPEDLEPILKKSGFDGCVTVQVNSCAMQILMLLLRELLAG